MNELPDYLKEILKGIENKDPVHINLFNKAGTEKPRIYNRLPFYSFGDLSKIKSIYATHHRIRHLSEQIGECSSLLSMDLSDNPLESLPESFGKLKNLRFFRASDTIEVDPIKYIDLLMAGPGHYPEYIGNAGLKDLPQSFGNLFKLETLQLDGNRFKEIPEGIFHCKSLKSLDLSANQIAYIDPAIGNLSNLTYLKLSRNNFHELPDTIGNLKKLKRLRLDSLDLWELPEGIRGLKSLEMLEICQGKLGHVNAEIQHLKKLKHLFLVDTEISEIDLNALRVFLPHTEIRFDIGF